MLERKIEYFNMVDTLENREGKNELICENTWVNYIRYVKYSKYTRISISNLSSLHRLLSILKFSVFLIYSEF